MFNVVSNFELSFLIGSLSFLHVTRTAIKFRVSLKLGQIGPKIAELSALKYLKIDFITFSRLLFIKSIFKLAVNKGMYNIFDVWEFRPDCKKHSKLRFSV